MDKITLKNMKFYAYHGVLPEEQIEGQNFFIDVELYADLKQAGETDDLEYTVDYSVVYGIIKYIVENNKFRLIEKLADTISREIMSRYKVLYEIVVRIRKPEAPIDGELDWAEVELKRLKDEL